MLMNSNETSQLQPRLQLQLQPLLSSQ
ncbi:unnamed protein product, partial [Rotaria sp. Silwood2]